MEKARSNLMDKQNHQKINLVVHIDDDLTTIISLERHDENHILNVDKIDKPRKGNRKSCKRTKRLVSLDL
jgi:hypothetical protein